MPNILEIQIIKNDGGDKLPPPKRDDKPQNDPFLLL